LVRGREFDFRLLFPKLVSVYLKFRNMPYKEVKVEKLYYTIGEVATMFKVNTSLIRFWEKEFEIIKPKKNKKGNRLFTKKDIDNFHIIFHLVKERGMTLKGAKQKMKENKEDTEHNFEIVKSLENIKDLLIEVREGL
jgi:DNA-binding transcriptional MerR regulator